MSPAEVPPGCAVTQAESREEGAQSGSLVSPQALLSNSHLGTQMKQGVFTLPQGQWGAVETFFNLLTVAIMPAYCSQQSQGK